VLGEGCQYNKLFKSFVNFSVHSLSFCGFFFFLLQYWSLN
jgi:hypothetical protein